MGDSALADAWTQQLEIKGCAEILDFGTTSMSRPDGQVLESVGIQEPNLRILNLLFGKPTQPGVDVSEIESTGVEHLHHFKMNIHRRAL